jgi:predicted transposase YbfD/YdcC
VHLLAVIDQRTNCVLHQRAVSPETNEHKAALELLKDLVLTGRVVTADAAFCHQDFCEAVVDSGGHYVLSVKENQPQLLAAISSEFAAEEAAFSPLRSTGTCGGA